jgi:hypothetical protein
LNGVSVEERAAVRSVLSKVVRGAKQELAATEFLERLGDSA